MVIGLDVFFHQVSKHDYLTQHAGERELERGGQEENAHFFLCTFQIDQPTHPHQGSNIHSALPIPITSLANLEQLTLFLESHN